MEIYESPTSSKVSQANNSTLFSDIKMVIVFTVDITLDPATAHPSLFLSEGNRCVTWGEKSQDLPEDPQRFCSLPCVLGHQVITSGRCYWEVEVGSHGAWDLGICRPHVMRKGRVCIKPEDGFWALRFYKQEYWALTSPETKLTVKVHPARVCIFLEYEEGSISFYTPKSLSELERNPKVPASTRDEALFIPAVIGQAASPRGEALFRCARPSGVPRGTANSTGSLASQRHPGKFPKVPGRRRGKRGFPAAPRERPRESFFNASRGPSPLPCLQGIFQTQGSNPRLLH